MTIIDELLILLDDLEQARAVEIPEYFKKPNLQIIFSSLGRLVNKGLVAKKTRRAETYYSITSYGINVLNKTLDNIKRQDNKDTWDGRWHIVIFDIPETKRKLRDSLRNLLKDLCYGMLTSSVWLSPWRQEESIKRFIKRNNMVEQIFYLETGELGSSYQSQLIARRCWDWLKIEQNYRDFLTIAERELSQFATSQSPERFSAKKLVFQYAEVVTHDPQLPAEIAPNLTLSRRAYDLYGRIRPYCLKI
jgi:phenylacetic acid degradation operon negative regulatory protein